MKGRASERSVFIRSAIPTDYPALLELWSRCGVHASGHGRESEAAFRRQLAEFPSLYLVAEDGMRIVGVVLGTHDSRKGWINRLAVHPDCRRCGLAAELVTRCDEAIRSQGIEIVCAMVEPPNTASCALFESLGFSADVPVRYYRKLSRPGV